MSSRLFRRPSPPRAVHQLLPRLAQGDAVGNQVRLLQRLLRGWGYASDIYAPEADAALKGEVRPPSRYAREADRHSVLLVHHSFASGLVPVVASAPGRVALVYHNITPSFLLGRFDRRLAAACERGRDELEVLTRRADLAFAYSDFSAAELRAAGVPRVERLPFAIDWEAFDAPPDPTMRARFDDGMRNVLFVGRGVPSKRLEDVLRVFAAYQKLYEPRSRLLIVGELHRDSAYGTWVHTVRQLLGVERVHILGRVGQAELSALYSVAHVYLSMSAHEGFGVPLLEAMHRRVPVVAYGAAAVPETLGGAGLCTFTREPMEVARLLAMLDADAGLRARFVDAQSTRVARLQAEATPEVLHTHLAPLFEDGAQSAHSGPPPPVDLVCPEFDAAPDSAPAQVAHRLLQLLRPTGGARLLTVRTPPGVPPAQTPPGAARAVHPADLPGDTDGPSLSSALEMALRVGTARTVLLAERPCLSEASLGRIAPRTVAVHFARAPEPWTATLRSHLGPHLLDPGEGGSDRVAALLAERLQKR
ncbi:MAG: glycosyltransferase [Myxococcaceae bacterium]|nr:glycosyltransferase [Myxococcaceae bacterium]